LPGPFPENELEILPDYVPAELQQLITTMRTAVEKTGLTTQGTVDEDRPNGKLVVDVLAARRRVVRFFTHPAFDSTRQSLAQVARDFQTREFHTARVDLDRIAAIATNVTSVNGSTFSTALRSTPIKYTEIRLKPANTPDGFIEVRVSATLKAYTGPKPNLGQLGQILLYHDFISGKPERAFRLGLLEAERLFGLREFDRAVTQYSALLASAGGLTLERRKFLALRSALATLASSDQRFRKSRAPADEERASITAQYDAAVQLVVAHGVSSLNPLRQQIEAYAQVQKSKLEAGFNVLGFKDSYVPILRPEFLLQKAGERIGAAKDAVRQFIDFRGKANQLDDQEAELLLSEQIGKLTQQIAQERVGVADSQTRLADERIAAIREQLDSLLRNSILSATGGILDAMASAMFDGKGTTSGLIESGNGVLSSIVGYFARQQELENQLRVAEIERSIAQREANIARLEQEIAALRKQFVQDRLAALGSRILNADLFYALANLFESLAETNVDVAIRWAYLYERAVAFKKLKPDLLIIGMDYRKAVAGLDTIVPAPDLLANDLTRVSDVDVPETQEQLLTENPISLRLSYPIEFSQFLQTGKMHFAISLYDLDKKRPGVFKRRLQKVIVRVLGLIPQTGFGGRLIHHGFFLLRDGATTLTASRLVPTQEEFASAFSNLQAGKAQGDPIGGVIPYLLDADRQEISSAPTAEGNPEPAAFALFEGKGETGRWTLEIDNMDLRLISDVLLTFVISFPESSAEVQQRVEDLIKTYEAELAAGDALDKTAAFSLRQQFPDSFDQLATGQASFPLQDSDFPPDITDLKVKAIVGQAVDADGKGVEGIAIDFHKQDTSFLQSKTTSAGGFTEEVSTPIPFIASEFRVPIQGAWTIHLPDPGQFGLLNDLRLFLVYEFKPR
jgi:hypothetical protein